MKSIKRLSLLFSILPLFLFGQDDTAPDLVFDKTFYDMENQWVVFPKKNTDSVYTYGVIYVDAMAGFTFDLQGTFKVMTDGRFAGTPNVNSVKIRLEQNINKVSELSLDRLQQLNLPKEAVFLKHYKVDPTKVNNMIAWGRHYNHVGAYEKALGFLLKAYKIDPHAAGLEFELAFNYNATMQYAAAAQILDLAIKNDPKNFWFYRELGYSYMNQKKLDEAEQSYLLGIEHTNDNQQKGELTYNMAIGYFNVRNKTKFLEWYDKAKQYISDPNSVFLKNLNAIKEQIPTTN